MKFGEFVKCRVFINVATLYFERKILFLAQNTAYVQR